MKTEKPSKQGDRRKRVNQGRKGRRGRKKRKSDAWKQRHNEER